MMTPAKMTTFRQRLMWQSQRLPLRQHSVRLLCLVACALMAYRTASLRQEVQAANSHLRYQQAANAGSTQTAETLNSPSQFLAFFPAEDPTEDFLRRVYSEAGKLNIKVAHVSLEPAAQPLAGLNEQHLIMTLSAPDESYRELIYSLLKHAPAISLTRLSASRNERGGFQVELVWGVFSR